MKRGRLHHLPVPRLTPAHRAAACRPVSTVIALVLATVFTLLLAAAAAAADTAIRVRVTNTLDTPRAGETVELTTAALEGRVAPQDLPALHVTDVRSGREVLAQAVDQDGDLRFDLVVFQLDLGPGETREIVARYATKDLGGAQPVVTVEGWNVARATTGP